MTTKYKNEKCRVVVNGETHYFDSRHEARYFRELKILERAGCVCDIQRQVRFHLIPAQKDKRGKLLERGVDYVADFTYTDTATGDYVVVDAKGYKTRDYIIKRKLMLWIHGIRVKEV